MVIEAEDQDKSEFNSAIAKLKLMGRIHDSLVESTFTHNYSDKYNGLTALYLQLVAIMKTDDDKIHEARWLYISGVYYTYLDKKAKNKSPSLNTWMELLKWEKELQNIIQKYGLALPKKQDARYAAKY